MRKKHRAQKHELNDALNLTSLLTFEATVGKRGRSSRCIILPKPILLNWNVDIGDKVLLKVLQDGNVLIDMKNVKKKNELWR